MTEYRPTDATPDAEALYASLRDQLAAYFAAGFEADAAAGTQSRSAPHLVGIHSGGSWVAERLHRDLGLPGRPGALDISFYRDDFNRIGLHGQVKPTEIDFEVDGAAIVLVDDVLYSGRTLRGALNVLFDFGRPARIELAVLVDRQTPEHDAREMPIAARWSGASLSLPRDREFVLSQAGSGFAFTISPTVRPVDPD